MAWAGEGRIGLLEGRGPFRPFPAEARRAAGQLRFFLTPPLEASGARRAVIALREGGSEPGEANGEAARPPGRGPSPRCHPPRPAAGAAESPSSPRAPSRAPEAAAAPGARDSLLPLLRRPPGAGGRLKPHSSPPERRLGSLGGRVGWEGGGGFFFFPPLAAFASFF